jgi:hypothetical protein
MATVNVLRVRDSAILHRLFQKWEAVQDGVLGARGLADEGAEQTKSKIRPLDVLHRV